jgi:hypothetical protein
MFTVIDRLRRLFNELELDDKRNTVIYNRKQSSITYRRIRKILDKYSNFLTDMGDVEETMYFQFIENMIEWIENGKVDIPLDNMIRRSIYGMADIKFMRLFCNIEHDDPLIVMSQYMIT